MDNEKKLLEDKTYRFIELKDSIDETINNLVTLINDENIFIDLIEKSEYSIRFEKFIQDTKESIDKNKEQIEELNKKKELVDQIIENNKDDKLCQHCSVILKALGLFE